MNTFKVVVSVPHRKVCVQDLCNYIKFWLMLLQFWCSLMYVPYCFSFLWNRNVFSEQNRVVLVHGLLQISSVCSELLIVYGLNKWTSRPCISQCNGLNWDVNGYTFKLLRNLTSERVKCYQDDQEVAWDVIRGPSQQLLLKPVHWLLRRRSSRKWFWEYVPDKKTDYDVLYTVMFRTYRATFSKQRHAQSDSSLGLNIA